MPTSHGSTIEEWGLTRVPDDEPPFLEIMKRLMGNKLHSGNTLWKHFKIMKGPHEICRYTVTDIAYITTNINLDRLSGPRMKHRDMIVDNCKSAGQDLKRLELLGLNCITNEDLYAGVEDEYEVKGMDFDGEDEITAELKRWLMTVQTPGAAGWSPLTENNALLQGQIKMLNEYTGELGGAKIKKVAVLTNKLASLHFQRGVFMMTFLKR
ncbi:hypothetical protein DL766_009587 [Monosporascus sp. MC13-8B]|uniref:Uncharacterized protein n=1 Tax=Monosporascus cannonballus TaxID=155416 RepID=A0ABY0H083_9PEZI|nr:hypothetical protein DL763_010782 [Monosporascus cannonballus]RYO81031.1 hypothetical protein DL762_007334 [Monosporascus cannonballus]RYP14732.1 hypothetical protein DL766_009587 [Monosporascus sp. MC13-8B]